MCIKLDCNIQVVRPASGDIRRATSNRQRDLVESLENAPIL